MASFSMEEFLGDGALRGLVPKLVEGGWDDVPTVKMMNSEDMDSMKLTRQQKDALEIRSYLHDRSLMIYADRLEASEKSLVELLNTNIAVLSSQFGMKRGHIARFIDRTSACRISMPPYLTPARERSMSPYSISSSTKRQLNVRTSDRGSSVFEPSIEQSAIDFKLNDGYVFKGIVACEPADARLCGCIQPPPVVDDVAPYSLIENISIQKLTPEYKVGMQRLLTTEAPPMKASELWHDKPAIILCIRRPGCIMCRAEAHQLYSRKPIFDAMGVQLVAALHEKIESEIKEFWPRYWGGIVILDRGKDFFKALGGGVLLKDKFITGFLLNSRAIANYKRAKAIGLERNFRGEGEIKGGLFIIGNGKRGIAYQFVERNFGDWAPIAEVLDICRRIQSDGSSHEESKS
ncbi:uncharacterized protein A4U43_C05F9160 [Asparagus officinalis]|uniref:Peroxiredoxin-like 2A n=1 Tax=Asparagus officinalis TaxID=4686 RepID=A0A5P1EUQ9_ASPOF|nr:uncharacterized protein LOC109842898 [Asparagus officinalis]ONK68241.1 uncharacterized protein A4U43_C05F9160 [Asparagus officinalis]